MNDKLNEKKINDYLLHFRCYAWNWKYCVLFNLHDNGVNGNNNTYFTGEETKFQRGKVTCPIYKWKCQDLGLNLADSFLL